MDKKLAPIALFVYARPGHTRQALESLKHCRLANRSKLFIFADAPRPGAGPETLEKIREVRELIRQEPWCGEVIIVESEVNKGVDESIIQGVTKLVNEYGRAIVLEDDLVLSPGFLEYMNGALEMYEEEQKVMNISAYMFPHTRQLPESFFVRNYMSSWGWATWKRAWDHFEPDAAKLYRQIAGNRKLIRALNIDDTHDFLTMLKNCAFGSDHPWDIRWHAVVCLKDGYDLRPGRSLVQNIGHDSTGVHCGTTDIYWHDEIAESVDLVKQPVVGYAPGRKVILDHFRSQWPSFSNRVKHRVKQMLGLI